MIVGEPSLMGGEMDDEDERYITRLENTQYDPTTAPSTHYMSPGFQSQQQQQQNPNLQSLLHQKQQFIPNSPLIHPNQVKREQMSFPGSPQQQQQQLPSMFSNNSPTAINGDLLTTGKKISTNSPQTPSANQVWFNHLYYFYKFGFSQNSSTPTSNTPTNSYSTVADKKQEPHTPPVTPQQTIATAS